MLKIGTPELRGDEPRAAAKFATRALRRVLLRPETVFYSAVGFLIVSYALVYAIDIQNLFGVRDLLVRVLRVPYFWFYWFQAPVENPLQWLMLGAVVIVFAMIAGGAGGRAERRGEREFALLMAIGFLLMLLEDAGDVRHVYRTIIEAFFGGGGYAIEDTYGLVGTLFELSYFGLIGGIIAFALLRYRALYRQESTVRRYFVRGFVLYALAVGSSWVGNAFRAVTDFRDVYTVAGDWVTARLFLTRADTREIFQRSNAELLDSGMHPLQFAFLDRVYEESLELLGAASFLVAAIALYDVLRHREDGTVSRRSRDGTER